MRFYSIVVLAAFLEQDSLIIWIFQDRYKHMTDNMIRYVIDTLKPWEFKSKALNILNKLTKRPPLGETLRKQKVIARAFGP